MVWGTGDQQARQGSPGENIVIELWLFAAAVEQENTRAIQLRATDQHRFFVGQSHVPCHQHTAVRCGESCKFTMLRMLNAIRIHILGCGEDGRVPDTPGRAELYGLLAHRSDRA